MSREIAPPSPKTIASWRKARAVELALSGLGFDDIANEVGYANRGTAWRVVQQALYERKVESVDEYRQLELARLDALQGACWDAAMSGSDLKAAEFVLKVSTQRSRLLGLVGMDMKVTAETAAPTTLLVGGSSDQ